MVVRDLPAVSGFRRFLMSAKRPDLLDVMVGDRIRIFRTDRGLSQSDLAEKIGAAFPQVRKYESGASRRFAGNEATSLA
jgi:ribosome-binding protein aMBF1 (putative translation factor)